MANWLRVETEYDGCLATYNCLNQIIISIAGFLRFAFELHPLKIVKFVQCGFVVVSVLGYNMSGRLLCLPSRSLSALDSIV